MENQLNTKIETVSIIYPHPRILLGMKKVRFGEGKYNGFGGKVENGETLEQAVTRETFEEAGINILDPEKMGEILFHFMTNQDHLVHFFRATKFYGDPKESDEMVPKWFYIDEIPYDKMWEDDKYWLPMLLNRQKFKGEFHFDDKFRIFRYKLEETEKF